MRFTLCAGDQLRELALPPLVEVSRAAGRRRCARTRSPSGPRWRRPPSARGRRRCARSTASHADVRRRGRCGGRARRCSPPAAATSHSNGPGQRLVEVAEVEREVALRRRPQAEVQDVGVAAQLHRRGRCSGRRRGRRPSPRPRRGSRSTATPPCGRGAGRAGPGLRWSFWPTRTATGSSRSGAGVHSPRARRGARRRAARAPCVVRCSVVGTGMTGIEPPGWAPIMARGAPARAREAGTGGAGHGLRRRGLDLRRLRPLLRRDAVQPPGRDRRERPRAAPALARRGDHRRGRSAGLRPAVPRLRRLLVHDLRVGSPPGVRLVRVRRLQRRRGGRALAGRRPRRHRRDEGAPRPGAGRRRARRRPRGRRRPPLPRTRADAGAGPLGSSRWLSPSPGSPVRSRRERWFRRHGRAWAGVGRRRRRRPGRSGRGRRRRPRPTTPGRRSASHGSGPGSGRRAR